MFVSANVALTLNKFLLKKRAYLCTYIYQVTILGTPAEEGGGGKVDMLRAGVFDEIDVAMMVHPGPTTSSHTSMVANDRFLYLV